MSRMPRPPDAPEWLLEHRSGIVIPSFDFRVDYAAATARGVDRSVNQDALICRPDAGIFVVADGMGGHAAGEVAARVAVDVVYQELREPQARECIQRYASEPELDNRRAIFELLGTALHLANEAVLEAGENDEARRGMGTTLDLVLLVRDRAFLAHVGDSRAYVVRPQVTLQLTNDHAAYDSLQTSGKRAPLRSPKSPLTNSIGHHRGLVVDTLFVGLSSGERLVLCTDGVSGAFDGEAPIGKACRSRDAAEAAHELIHAARAEGATDDATVVTITIKERFAKRQGDAGPRARDIATMALSPLLIDLPPADVLSALQAGVEVELAEGAEVPRAVTSDRVAYIILDGLVELPNGRRLGPSGMLMAESLLDVPVRGQLPRVIEHARLLRIRHDDFNEVCNHNAALAAELYKRLARHMVTAGG
jgi:serine/threonine protein phosphatase PrpC